MININGKVVVIMGYGIIFLLELATLFFNLFELNFNLEWIRTAALFIIAGGFGITWLIRKNAVDFLSAVLVGISALISIVQSHVLFSGFVFWIVRAGSSLPFFAVALRALYVNNTSYNKLLSFTCVCVGIYWMFAGYVMLHLIYPLIGLPIWLMIIWNIGFIVCPGVCILECLQEE